MSVLSSFNQENHDRILKEASKKEGIAEGQKILLQDQINKKLQKGCTVPEIAQALEQDEETIEKLVIELQAQK